MEKTSESPNVSQTIQTGQIVMDFPAAIKKVIDGQKITRLEWKNKKYYGVLHNQFLMLHKPDSKLHAWTISEGDLWGKDWIVIGDSKKLLPF